MSVFHREEQPRESKRCMFLATVLKEVFSNCHTFHERRSDSGLEEEYSASDIDDESQVIVSQLRSRAMEKMKHRPSLIGESISWVLSPSKRSNPRDDKEDEFFSTPRPSCFSLYSSGVSGEAFVSANTDFSGCSSLSKVDFGEVWNFQDLRKRSMIGELCDCEGWPFGLCKKTVLLPPLPKSPSGSWSWRKGTTCRLPKLP